jgi:hypothetical protein
VFERRSNYAAAGVVDQDVDVPESSDRRRDQVVGHARVLELSDESSRDVNLVPDILQVFLRSCRGENAGAVGDKPPCDT